MIFAILIVSAECYPALFKSVLGKDVHQDYLKAHREEMSNETAQIQEELGSTDANTDAWDFIL